MVSQNRLELLKACPFLHGLSDTQIENLVEISSEQDILPNGVIFEEGEESNDAYIVLEGEVGVLKWDEEHGAQILLGKVGKGGAFGEISFMDSSQRSATIKATKPTKILKITRNAITTPEVLSTLLSNIATININRLKNANAVFVKNLQESRHGLQFRLESGSILLNQTFILGVCIVLTLLAFKGSSYLPWLMAIFPSALLIRSSKISFHKLGVNLENWVSTLVISLLITSVTLIFLFLLPSIHWQFTQAPFFLDTRLSSWLVMIFYCASQEFIARGVLQNSFQNFFQDNAGYKSVLFNSCFLFLLFLPLGMTTATNLLVMGLPLGYLYLKQKSLLGVILIHFLLIGFGIITI